MDGVEDIVEHHKGVYKGRKDDLNSMRKHKKKENMEYEE